MEINLLDRYPKSQRPLKERSLKVTDQDKNIARNFDKEFFDGDRLTGYGGYYYDSRFWTETVKRFQEFYGLSASSKILDIGSAKGFFLYDFIRLIQGICVYGLDISRYAIEHSNNIIKPYLIQGTANHLPFPDKTFDLVISINTIHNLPLCDCRQAICEIIRVSKGKSFITMDAWRNEEEKLRLLDWNLTAKTYMHVDDWKNLFAETGYSGDYFWFIAE